MNNVPHLKHRIHHMLQGQHLLEPWAAVFNISLASLIILNVLALMLETMNDIYQEWQIFFFIFEMFSVSIFIIEYLLRVWVANLNPKYQHPLGGRIRYLFSPLALVDLLAFLPSLLLLSGLDLRSLRMLRLFRVVRLLHVPRVNKAMHAILEAARSKSAEFIIAGTIMFVLLILCSDATSMGWRVKWASSNGCCCRCALRWKRLISCKRTSSLVRLLLRLEVV